MFMDKLAKVLLACCGIFLVIGVIYLVVLRVNERQSWHNDIAID